MSKSAKKHPGDHIGPWRLEERIGGGGNGVVWRVSRSGSPDHALKILRRLSDTTRARLHAEIAALGMAATIDGVVPLVEHEIPHNGDRGPQWFVMPLAQKPETAFASTDAADIVRPFIAVARTLAELHALDIHHRDIKPANLLFLNNRLCLSDFGLVKFPERPDITPPQGAVGPKFTMAPEMRREAAEADGGPADVYSLAKTLWVMLTGQPLGFDGQYAASGVLALSTCHPHEFVGPLDELLAECTDNDPTGRPSASELADRLEHWVELNDDFHRRNLAEWVTIQRRLFPVASPVRATWTDLHDICSVLRSAANTPSLNQMFYPDGGGNTISEVDLAGEPGLIAIRALTTAILKPRSLTIETFRAGPEWNYFRLEADPIDPIEPDGGYIDEEGIAEHLCEIAPGQYVGIDAWDSASTGSGRCRAERGPWHDI